MKPVYVIEGNSKERHRFLNNLKESMPNHEYFAFDENHSYEYVSQVISEQSCFGLHKLFVIKELPTIKINSKKEEAGKSQMRTKVLNSFKKLFPVIPFGNVVVFDGVGISSEGFFTEVKKHGEVNIYKQKVTKDEAKKIIFNYFKKRSIEVNDDISTLMADSLNFLGSDVDVDMLFIMMEKMYHFVYGKNKITDTTKSIQVQGTKVYTFKKLTISEGLKILLANTLNTGFLFSNSTD